MAEVTLTPGAVTLVSGSDGFSPHVDSVVVGSPPQWADASDATYATVHRKAHDTEPWSGSDHAVAPLGGVSGTATAITATIRASSTGAGATAIRCVLSSATYGSFMEDASVTRGGTVQTVVGAFPDDDPDPEFNSLAQAAAALAEGATLDLSVGSPFGADLTVYEVTLTVTTADVEEVLVTRLWPRDDGYGLGSAHRIYPPPRRGRIVGGQH